MYFLGLRKYTHSKCVALRFWCPEVWNQTAARTVLPLHPGEDSPPSAPPSVSGKQRSLGSLRPLQHVHSSSLSECLCLHMCSLSVHLSSSYKDTIHTGLRAHSTPIRPHLIMHIYSRDPFKVRSYSQVLGGQISYLSGDALDPKSMGFEFSSLGCWL